jgi:hypothetical protein
MPVSFLTPAQHERFGRYAGTPSADDLARYFHLDDADLALIAQKRGEHNRLGFALQLTTVRFLGTFLEDPLDVPTTVLYTLSRQLFIPNPDRIVPYREGRQRQLHVVEIRTRYGYRDFTDRDAGFRLARWLYALCWTGTERPGILFERATDYFRIRSCYPASACWNVSSPSCVPGSRSASGVCWSETLRRNSEDNWRVC